MKRFLKTSLSVAVATWIAGAAIFVWYGQAKASDKQPTGTNLYSPGAYAGEPTDFWVNITWSPNGSPAPSGQTDIYEGSRLIGSGAVSEGKSTVIYQPGFSQGEHTFVAQYSGDSYYLPSTSAPYTRSITGYRLTVDIGSSKGGSPRSNTCARTTYGEAVTFVVGMRAANTQPPPGRNPTGAVTFYDGCSGCNGWEVLGSATPEAKEGEQYWLASITLKPSLGTHTVYGSFEGDYYFAPASSRALTLCVDSPPSSSEPGISPTFHTSGVSNASPTSLSTPTSSHSRLRPSSLGSIPVQGNSKQIAEAGPQLATSTSGEPMAFKEQDPKDTSQKEKEHLASGLLTYRAVLALLLLSLAAFATPYVLRARRRDQQL